jgi:hypothetical protein
MHTSDELIHRDEEVMGRNRDQRRSTAMAGSGRISMAGSFSIQEWDLQPRFFHRCPLLGRLGMG